MQLKIINYIVEGNGSMSIIKKDYSATCDLNDENLNNDCRKCTRFVFPIGCMVGEEEYLKSRRRRISKNYGGGIKKL